MVRKVIDEVGNVYNRLTVTSFAENRGTQGNFWNCVCSCGNETIVSGAKLRRAHTQSCGCLGKEKLLLRTKHGLWGTPAYWSWAMMLQRCNNPNASKYEEYGGRGIEVLDGWELFEKFYGDMGACPDGMSIERINVNGNYCKENCKWETDSRQNFNRRLNSNNTSGKSGVDFVENYLVWRARITVDLKEISLGQFANFEDAVIAREEAEIKYFGFNKE